MGILKEARRMTYEVNCLNCGNKFYVRTMRDVSSRLYCDLCQKKVIEEYNEEHKNI